MNEAIICDDWEFHLVNGHLFITSERDPDVQVQLSAEAAICLLNYLYHNRSALYTATHATNEENMCTIDNRRSTF